MSLSVGDVIHGFADGWFGRDSYECRSVEAFGIDWVVTRSLRQRIAEAATGPGVVQRVATAGRWSNNIGTCSCPKGGI